MTIKKPVFKFISAYKGTFDYGVTFPDGTTGRLSVRAHREEHDAKYSTLAFDDWERQVNGKLGLVCLGRSERLTEELVADFNRYRFLSWQAEVNQILANPKRYGEYVPEPLPLFMGGEFDVETKRWSVIHDFEVIRAMAGIPLDQCRDPRKSIGQLSLAA